MNTELRKARLACCAAAALVGCPAQLLGTHPDPAARIDVLQMLMPKVLPLYSAAND